MSASLTKRIATVLVSGAVALGAMSLTPASAYYRHGGYHGGYRHHYGYGYGYRRHYYGGYYYGRPYYGYPGCIPALGLLSGNFCNGYYY